MRRLPRPQHDHRRRRLHAGGWRDLIGDDGRSCPTEREAAITQYLATHFPPKPGRAPELVAGDVSVTFKEWMVPTLGQRSRDPLQTADGTIWWNGQFISLDRPAESRPPAR